MLEQSLANHSTGMTAVEIIRVVGTSSESWEAAEEASRRASQPVDGTHGMKVKAWTAEMGQDGSFEQYQATVELSFPVHESQ